MTSELFPPTFSGVCPNCYGPAGSCKCLGRPDQMLVLTTTTSDCEPGCVRLHAIAGEPCKTPMQMLEEQRFNTLNQRFYSLLTQQLWAGTLSSNHAPLLRPKVKKTLRTRWKALKARAMRLVARGQDYEEDEDAKYK